MYYIIVNANNKGSVHLIALVIVGLAALLSLFTAGYFYLQTKNLSQQKPTPVIPTTPKLPETPPTESTTNWLTYTNPQIGFSIKYPRSWFIIEHQLKEQPNSFMLLFDTKPIPQEWATQGLTHGWSNLNIQIEKQHIFLSDIQKDVTFAGDLDSNGIRYGGYTSFPTTFAGIMANKSYVTSPDRAESGSWSTIVFNFKDKSWLVHYPNTDFKGSHDSIYDKILNSFEFVDLWNTVQITNQRFSFKLPPSWGVATNMMSGQFIPVTQSTQIQTGSLFYISPNNDYKEVLQVDFGTPAKIPPKITKTGDNLLFDQIISSFNYP